MLKSSLLFNKNSNFTVKLLENTRIFNLISVRQITRFLLRDTIILSNTEEKLW